MPRVKTLTGPVDHMRLVIKTVPDAHVFLNKQPNNDWSVYDGPLTAGTYARVGGEWRNLRTIDPSTLPFV